MKGIPDLKRRYKKFKHDRSQKGPTPEVFALGVDILVDYLPHSAPIRRKLVHLQRNPNPVAFQHLDHQMKKVLRRFSVRVIQPPQAPVRSEPKPTKDPDVVETLPAAFLPDAAKNPEQLTRKIRKIAQKRAMLTNQLVAPGEDEDLVQKNIDLIDQINGLVDQIEQLEDLRAQNEEIDGVVVVEIDGRRYTEKDLYSLALAKCHELKSDLETERKRIVRNNRRAKTKKTKTKNKTLIVRYEAMANVVERVILEKKIRSNA